MRKSRFIQNTHCGYDLLNVYFDADQLVVRLLVEDSEIESTVAKKADVLLSFDRLINMAVEKDGKYYGVIQEAVYKKRDPANIRSWCTCANIVCLYRHGAKDSMFFADKSEETFIKRWRTNWFIERNHLSLPFQMFVLDAKDGIDVVSKSFAAKSIDSIVTNMDTKDLLAQSADQIAADSSFSEYFQAHFKLAAPETCRPDETFEVAVQAVNADGVPIDVNYTFELDAVSGYLPNRRVELKNGRGSFRATALGLLPGEDMRIKFGKKISPCLAERIVKVV